MIDDFIIWRRSDLLNDDPGLQPADKTKRRAQQDAVDCFARVIARPTGFDRGPGDPILFRRRENGSAGSLAKGLATG
jgi:hypothetical protein